MLFRDVIDLISTESQYYALVSPVQLVQIQSENDIGDVIEIETPRQVFANKKSIRQSEFYQAMATGLKPEIMFEIRGIEYNGEQVLQYNGKAYSIVRTYSKNDEILELVCSGLVVQ